MQIPTFEPQVVIIGSGPAGVSAAFPLVEKGMRVLMLDGGRETTGHFEINKHDTLRRLRQSSKHWKIMIGERFERFEADRKASPKYRVPAYHQTLVEFKQRYAIRTDNFKVYGLMTRGGLSNLWGAGVSRFDDADLEEFPIRFEDLRRSYQYVTQRIGVSGSNDDDLSDFHGREESLQPPWVPRGNARLLYNRYLSRPKSAHKRGVHLGHVKSAILTLDHQSRQGCVNCGLCTYGCAGQSIWSAKYDLEKLLQFPNFNYRDSAFVSYLRRLDTAYEIGVGPDLHRITRKIQAKNVILASGTISSARLVMDALELYDKNRELLSDTMAMFAFAMPHWRIGSLVDEDVVGSAQLTFRVARPHAHARYGSGYIYLADTNPTSDFLPYMPFAYPLSRRVVRRLQPMLLIGICYLGGNYTRNTMRVRPSGDVEICGGRTSAAAPAMNATITRLGGALMHYGAYLLPGSISLGDIGVDAHYAGTVPMRNAPRVGEANSHGEVQGLPGVYVVDGSALTALPAKVHTLTIMANADRIANIIATNGQS